MKKLILFLFVCSSIPSIYAQETKNITYDYFKTNSQSIPLKKTTPNGTQMTIYLDMLQDWKKNDLPFVMEQIDKGLQLFKDSLYDATQTHVLEVAITPHQKNTFYRYTSYPNAATDVTIIDNEIVHVKHTVDTIRVYEHFLKTNFEDTTTYKNVYEILSKNISETNSQTLTSQITPTLEKSWWANEKKYKFSNVISKFGVYFGVGLASSNVYPIAFHSDMGLVFATGRTTNGFTPFVGYNMRYALTYIDDEYRGASFHLLEWGMMKSSKTPYHLAYNKYSVGIGIMNTTASPEWQNGFNNSTYMLGMVINFPIFNNLGVSVETGNNFKKSNPSSFVGVSIKAYLSGQNF